MNTLNSTRNGLFSNVRTIPGNYTRFILCLFLGAFLTLFIGCRTPSEIYIKYNEKGNIIEKNLKYDNSAFYSGRTYGLDLGVDPDTKIPRIRIGIIKYDSGSINKNQEYKTEFRTKDVNFWNENGKVVYTTTIKASDKARKKKKINKHKTNKK